MSAAYPRRPARRHPASTFLRRDSIGQVYSLIPYDALSDCERHKLHRYYDIGEIPPVPSPFGDDTLWFDSLTLGDWGVIDSGAQFNGREIIGH